MKNTASKRGAATKIMQCVCGVFVWKRHLIFLTYLCWWLKEMQEATSGLTLPQVLSKKQANLSDAQTNGYFCFNLFHFCVFVSCNFHLYKLLKPCDGAINPLRPLNFFGIFSLPAEPDCVL